MATPTLETKRLILRPLHLADAPAVQQQFPHWNVVKFLSNHVPWPYPEDGAEQFVTENLAEQEAANVLCWAITIRQHGTALAGLLEFRISPPEHPTGQRGFWLAEEFWGRGYMTEAVAVVNDYLFGELEIERFKTENAVANTASSKIKESKIGRLVEVTESDFLCGRLPCEIWEVTRQDWLNSTGRKGL